MAKMDKFFEFDNFTPNDNKYIVSLCKPIIKNDIVYFANVAILLKPQYFTTEKMSEEAPVLVKNNDTNIIFRRLLFSDGYQKTLMLSGKFILNDDNIFYFKNINPNDEKYGLATLKIQLDNNKLNDQIMTYDFQTIDKFFGSEEMMNNFFPEMLNINENIIYHPLLNNGEIEFDMTIPFTNDTRKQKYVPTLIKKLVNGQYYETCYFDPVTHIQNSIKNHTEIHFCYEIKIIWIKMSFGAKVFGLKPKITHLVYR
jgi:hypothetical protein